MKLAADAGLLEFTSTGRFICRFARLRSPSRSWAPVAPVESLAGCPTYWMCWQKAAADAADPALILEDDAVLLDHCAARLQSRVARLSAIDPHWDLLYLGRWALDDEDRTVTEGIVHPGYSYCTFGYLLSASGLAALLNCGFERALIPVDELIPALYMDHPREDIRSLYPKRLRGYALEPPLVTQLPKDEAGSDTEASAFVASKR
jgi:glycosyl transferase family 25